MKRRGVTLIEVVFATAVTLLIAGVVIAAINAVTDSTQALDISAQAMVRLARAESRVADHANRARLVLSQNSTEILLWLPTEALNSSTTNATDYGAINGNELAWYVMKTATKTLYLCYLTNRNNRTVYSLNTSWTNLHTSLSAQGALTEIPVLEGLVSGGFRVEDSDSCSVLRFTFDGILGDDFGGVNAQLGGRLLNGLRHPDCP